MEAETERRMGEKMTEIYDKIKGHAVTQSDAKPSISAGLIEAAMLDDILTTLKHARVFITSREKMHPTGIELYDELIERLAAIAQSDAEPNVPPLRYSDKVEKSLDGTETRSLEIAQPDTEPANYIPIGGAGNGA